ncbi:alpha/beta hydrolase-fold protein [Cytophaga sp. FL35]|uniref:alpha/beta hydrolase n=1 Tax=Cytophaga sp. FL35 TaxID=1904456 RepID=UPI0016537C87|nr:alpha/beta hydrolase-fold protein [Cytophaga sp. FL35]MBC6998629.1 esterase family protein [Cytophaga sp. FL35]
MNIPGKFLFLTLILFYKTCVFAQSDSPKILLQGETFDKKISDGENHDYTLHLTNGMAVIGKVTQDGIDLKLDVYSPDGKFLEQIDIAKSKKGDNTFDITADQTGYYKFVIRSLEKGSKGRYTLTTDQIVSLSQNMERISRKELPTSTLFNLWKSTLTDSSAIDTFLASKSSRHIIEPIPGDSTHMLVTYFCVPTPHTEYVMLSGGPDFLGLRFQRLPNSNLHFVTQKVPIDARFNYGFNYFILEKAGPNNEIETRNLEHAYDGILEMPNAPEQPYIIVKENVKKGTMVEKSIKSETLGEERKITIHLPSNYDAEQAHHLLIIFDGESYGGRLDRSPRVPTATIMDNLLAEKKIPPTVTVLVWSMGTRNKDMVSEKFGDFIATELIPKIRTDYSIYPESDKIVLAGSSRGGFAASFTALRHSDVIGNVLSQSGSYWITAGKNENHWIYPEYDGKLISAYKNSELLPVRFYMDVGLYDAGASMLGMNRQFRDILELKGYKVDYHEFKGGHSYVNWRGTLSDGIISLIGTK